MNKKVRFKWVPPTGGVQAPKANSRVPTETWKNWRAKLVMECNRLTKTHEIFGSITEFDSFHLDSF